MSDEPSDEPPGRSRSDNELHGLLPDKPPTPMWPFPGRGLLLYLAHVERPEKRMGNDSPILRLVGPRI